MAIFSAAPMDAYAWAYPNMDAENPHFVISVEWTWPEQDLWTRFRLVRSIRSPCTRIEEGQVVLETDRYRMTSFSDETGRPLYRDEQPPPGEWVHYTAFVLDNARVWRSAGSVAEIGIMDYDWTLRLPELLPGVSVSAERGVQHPSDQSHELVQFMQSPGAFLDMNVTKAEAAQYFWDPLRVPPQALSALAESWGYHYTGLLGVARTREVMAAIRRRGQGSLAAISSIARAAHGGEAVVTVSDNLMLDLNDSSFESGKIEDTHWASTGGATPALYVEDYEDHPLPARVPPNVRVTSFLTIPTARTITCGASDPVKFGVPVSSWTKARMGVHAVGKTGSPAGTVDLGMDLYDMYGVLIQRLHIHGPRTITLAQWDWYGSPDDPPEAMTVPIPPGLGHVYGVPYITVTQPCHVDLIVVDDGA